MLFLFLQRMLGFGSVGEHFWSLWNTVVYTNAVLVW